jgi:glycosyltransferase involved in cell wall biosynthesis
MRILQVSNQYLPEPGGVTEYVKNISERLATGHEVHVFTTDSYGMPENDEINGVFIKRFRSFSPDNAYYMSFYMLSELKKAEFDIVHGHNYHALPLFLSRYARKKRFVVTPHYNRYGVTRLRNVLIRMYKPFGQKIFQEANKVIALSNREKCLLMEDFQIDDRRIAVIPGGVDLKHFKDLEKTERKDKIILVVARLEEFKGIQYAIRVLPLLDNGVQLEIVGKGPYKEQLIREAKKLGVAHRIAFYQDLQGQDMIDRYANSDLFMLLSRHESYGITVAEALASKTPSIVTNIPALKQWVDNRNCFGIDYPIEIAKLASLITRVMGQKVQGVEIWDWDDVAKQIELVYLAQDE